MSGWKELRAKTVINRVHGVCIVQTCINPSFFAGVCQKHLKMKNSVLVKLRVENHVPEFEMCRHDRCTNKPTRARGWCSRHYEIVREMKMLDILSPPKGKKGGKPGKEKKNDYVPFKDRDYIGKAMEGLGKNVQTLERETARLQKQAAELLAEAKEVDSRRKATWKAYEALRELRDS
jgi:hypothetical protein